MTTYAIRGGEEGARRLELLAQVMAPSTEALIAASGVGTGMSCLDVGCGAGHVSRSLASRVGPSGRVLGLDFDPVTVEHARREAEQVGLQNVDFRVANVTIWSDPAVYDVIYGRFIVSHLADRRGFIARLRGSLRVGGTLVLEDIDMNGTFCHPANRAFTRSCELYAEVVARRGGDATVGVQLYQLCREAGLEDLHVQVVQPTYGGSPPAKSLTLSTLINTADAIVAEGLATTDELRQMIAELRAFTEDSGSVMGCPRIFQVWGRRSPESRTG